MRRPITDEALATLAAKYGDRWKIWRSNPDGWYACASRRQTPPWAGRPDGDQAGLPLTLVEDSAEELAEALERTEALERAESLDLAEPS